MGFFDSPENVQQYIKMTEGYDGKALIEKLKHHLPEGSSLLELGMGPGKDLDMLKEVYDVTGSDSSEEFLKRYHKLNPDVPVIQLDAISIDTVSTFDCIYSNKVLHHLSRAELIKSFERQYHVLNPGGLLFHSFWHGDREEEMEGLRFVYYREENLIKEIGSRYQLLEQVRYTELEEMDSFYLLLRKPA